MNPTKATSTLIYILGIPDQLKRGPSRLVMLRTVILGLSAENKKQDEEKL